jgi:hypothetical protein
MYIFYKVDEGQIEIVIPENSFLTVTNKDFMQMNSRLCQLLQLKVNGFLRHTINF